MPKQNLTAVQLLFCCILLQLAQFPPGVQCEGYSGPRAISISRRGVPPPADFGSPKARPPLSKQQQQQLQEVLIRERLRNMLRKVYWRSIDE